MTHPSYQLPDEPHAKYHYEIAMKHVEAAKKAGKSTAEIHAIFKKCMHPDLDNLPTDAAHAKYASAVKHARLARANGKSSKEAHELFRRVMNAEPGQGHCKSK